MEDTEEIVSHDLHKLQDSLSLKPILNNSLNLYILVYTFIYFKH